MPGDLGRDKRPLARGEATQLAANEAEYSGTRIPAGRLTPFGSQASTTG